MFRHPVIIVLSLLAIAAAVDWVDIYRPRTTIADLKDRVKTLGREIDGACGTSWRKWQWFPPPAEMETSCPEGEGWRREYLGALYNLNMARDGRNNSVASHRGTSFGGLEFGVAKKSRFAAGYPSTRLLGSIATVSYTVPWNEKPKGATGAIVRFGDFILCRGPKSPWGGAGGWMYFKVSIPVWALSMLFGTYPFIALIRGPVRRWRRRARGLCTGCGYNLTGLPSAICPECGMAGQERSFKDSGCDE